MLLSNENGKWRLRDVDVSSKELDVNALNVVESLAHIGDDHHYSLMSDGFPTLLVRYSSFKVATVIVDASTFDRQTLPVLEWVLFRSTYCG